MSGKHEEEPKKVKADWYLDADIAPSELDRWDTFTCFARVLGPGIILQRPTDKQGCLVQAEVPHCLVNPSVS
jgi:hypothetical protein